MVSLLLPIIYLAFISLGLPDSLLGSAWPIMFGELNVPISYAGIISMIISAGTIVSSLFSEKASRKLGTGLVAALSTLLTAAALFGFSVSKSFIVLCFLSVPYGLGAGAIDAVLNNYLALHYSSRHMSWAHCLWGLGVSVSPHIMSYALSAQMGWNSGYGIVSGIQFAFALILFSILPIWKIKEKTSASETNQSTSSLISILRIKGVKPTLIAFFCYCAFETTCGLWASTFLAEHKGLSATTAAGLASMFYIGITFGRFLNGFISDKLGNKRMIRYGSYISVFGALLIALPVSSSITAIIGLIVVGFGCSPIYPCIIHSTPTNFGKENSGSIVGIEMAAAYCGSTFMPPVFGFLAQNISLGLYPFYLALFGLLMLIMSERVNMVMKQKNI